MPVPVESSSRQRPTLRDYLPFIFAPSRAMRSDAMTAEIPLISVVMPCLNAERYLGEAIGSALRQSYGNVELIVVDDGSTDASLAISTSLAEEYAGRLTLLRAKQGGPIPLATWACKGAGRVCRVPRRRRLVGANCPGKRFMARSLPPMPTLPIAAGRTSAKA